MLPEFLDSIELKNLRVGSGSVDILAHRRARYAIIEVQRQEDAVEVVTET